MACPCHGIRHGRGARGPAYQCTRHSRDESHRHAGKRNSDTRVRIESKSGRNKAIVVEVRTMATPSDQNQVRELVGCWDCSVPAPSQAQGWKAALNERLLNKRWMDGGWMDGECMTWAYCPKLWFPVSRLTLSAFTIHHWDGIRILPSPWLSWNNCMTDETNLIQLCSPFAPAWTQEYLLKSTRNSHPLLQAEVSVFNYVSPFM